MSDLSNSRVLILFVVFTLWVDKKVEGSSPEESRNSVSYFSLKLFFLLTLSFLAESKLNSSV